MKKSIYRGIFISSLLFNFAALSTIAWQLLHEHFAVAQTHVGEISEKDNKHFQEVVTRNTQSDITKIRNVLLDKRSEILDVIAEQPGNFIAIEKSVYELNVLRSDLERQAYADITRAAAELTSDKRIIFVSMLKNRTCIGPGMGKSRGCSHCCPTR